MRDYTFDPVQLSRPECEWLLAHIDEPAIVALRTIRAERMPRNRGRKNGIAYPDGVNPNSVRPVLEMIQELEDLSKHEGQKWVGKEAVKKAIRTYLAQDAKWEADYIRTRGRAPRFPSLYTFDSKGRAHLGGPGSDSGQVRTYFDEKGNRVPFAISLIEVDEAWDGPIESEKPEAGLVVNAELSRIDCFCGHTEKFKDGSRASFNAARARMSKHLRKATEEVEKHRELHTNEFGG